jgi:hypothetical protein
LETLAGATPISTSAKRRIGSIGAARVPTLSSLTLEQWLGEFDRLRKGNAELFKPAKATWKKPGRKR